MTGGKTIEIADGPHEVSWTHANEVKSACSLFSAARREADRERAAVGQM
jgi:hypothetical protein